MKKLLLLAVMVTMFLSGANAQTDDYDDVISQYGLMFYGFDGFENYGLTMGFRHQSGLGFEAAVRSQFKKHGNKSSDWLIHYTPCILSKGRNSLFLSLAAGPSLRLQDDVKGIKNNGDIEWESKFTCDGVVNPRLIIKIGRVMLSGGYFYWAPKFKFNKDDGATDGYNIGLAYTF